MIAEELSLLLLWEEPSRLAVRFRSYKEVMNQEGIPPIRFVRGVLCHNNIRGKYYRKHKEF